LVNSGCASIKSMMRRSGVSPAVKRWKLSWVMLRRAASGHMPATQVLKLAAASRIALAVIRGWPEAPSSPLQGVAEGLPGTAGGCAGWSDFWPEKMPPNRLESPPPDCWAVAGPAAKKAATSAAASRIAIGSIRGIIFHPLPAKSGFQEACSHFPGDITARLTKAGPAR